MTVRGAITRIRYFFQYRHIDKGPVATCRKNGVIIGDNVKLINEYLKKHKDAMKDKPVFSRAWELTPEEKAEAKRQVLELNGGYDL